MNALNFIFEEDYEPVAPRKLLRPAERPPKIVQDKQRFREPDSPLRLQKVSGPSAEFLERMKKTLASKPTPQKFVRPNELTFKPKINSKSSQILEESRLRKSTTSVSQVQSRVEDRLLAYGKAQIREQSKTPEPKSRAPLTPDKVNEFYAKRELTRKRFFAAKRREKDAESVDCVQGVQL